MDLRNATYITRGPFEVDGISPDDEAFHPHDGIVGENVVKLGSKCTQRGGEEHKLSKKGYRAMLRRRVGFVMAASRHMGHLGT